MLNFLITLQAFVADRVERDEKGATMVEYGLMVALVAIVAAVGATLLGNELSALFTTISNQI